MTTPELPAGEVKLLTSLRNTAGLPQLRARIRQLRAEGGWTLDDIATPLGTYRSTVRTWEHHPDGEITSTDALPELPIKPGKEQLLPALRSPLYPRLGAPMLTVLTRPSLLLPDETKELKELSRLARRVRGHTAPSARSRVASDDFDALLKEYRTRGVAVRALATAANLTERAIRTRLHDVPEDLPELIDAPPEVDRLILVWPAPLRRWSSYFTYDERPVAFDRADLVEPPRKVFPYYLLSPLDAQQQLGWLTSNTVYFPAARSLT